MSEDLNTFIPRVPSDGTLLNKHITKTSTDVSFLDGKTALEGAKAGALGLPTRPPDQSSDILDDLDDIDLSAKAEESNGLSQEELEEIIRKRKEERKQLEMLVQERQMKLAEEQEKLSMKTSGSEENPALINLAPDSKPSPVVDRSEVVARTYTPPPKIDLGDGAPGATLSLSPEVPSAPSFGTPDPASSSLPPSPAPAPNLDEKA